MIRNRYHDVLVTEIFKRGFTEQKWNSVWLVIYAVTSVSLIGSIYPETKVTL